MGTRTNLLPQRELVALELGPLLRGEPRQGGDVLDGDEQHVLGGYGALLCGCNRRLVG